MGPFIERRRRPWEPDIPVAHTPRYSEQVAERMRDRYRRGMCPCNCGNTVDDVRIGWRELIETYERTGIWDGPLANA